MAIYTVGRRRVILGLLLTAALLLTLDLRGNPVIDVAREGFTQAMTPVERASEVVTNPIQRGWNAYQRQDDLERELAALQDQLDRQRGTQAAQEAAIIDYQLLLALEGLDSLAGIETVVAQVVGGSSNNIDQIIEINVGTEDGVRVGMAVVNQAGLIGRITDAQLNTSKVMLVTDPRYSVPVEILGGTGASDETGETVTTTPSGRTPEENEALIEGAEESESEDVEEAEPEPGSPDDVFADEVDLPQAGDEIVENPADPAVPGPSTTTLPEAIPADGDDLADPLSTTTTTTTTTLPAPELLEKEFGTLRGNGADRLPQIRFVQDIPSLAVLQVGDLVETSGGSLSLAPPNIPIGRVINRADRPGVAGPLLEVELIADLDKLNFVQVVLFQPLTEVGQ